MDTGVNKPWQTLVIPSAITSIGQLHQSPPSPRLREIFFVFLIIFSELTEILYNQQKNVNLGAVGTRCCEAPLDIWGAEQLRTGCLSILMFLTPLAEVTP